MRTTRITLSALLLAGTLSVAAAAQPPAPALVQPALNAAVAVGVGFHGTVGVDFFYSNLAPYGYWVNRPSYGWVWLPRHARHGWRPYSAGRWVYTDYGWTWASAEPFGWATYHYGRWYDDPDYGWGWVPGTDWGPAWVSWQDGGGYCGWAPLPPAVGWSVGVGFGGFDFGVIDPGWYNFVPERSFLAVNVGAFAVPTFRNVEVFRNTTNITNFSNVGGRVFNGGLSVQRAAQMTGQPVRQLQLANAANPRVARVSGNSVAMFRPASVVRQANAPDPTRVAGRSVLTGRAASQLAQQRRTEATTFNTRGNQQAGRSAAGMTSTSRAQQQAQARRQGAPMGRQSQTLGRNARRQVTPPPQRTRGGTPPREGARSQQVHQFVPPPQHQQVMRQSAPPPRPAQFERQRQGPPPQAMRQSAPMRQEAPMRQAAPMRQEAPMRQAAPPTRQAAPPTRQAPQARPAPAPRQQQQRREGPPPPAGSS